MKRYARRRAALIAQMQANGGGIAIVPTAPEVKRNSDADYPYRHDSYFYYLTGFTEPEAVLVLTAPAAGSQEKPQSILFCRAKDPEREIWDGLRYGPDAACAAFGFDAAFTLAALDEQMLTLLVNAPALFYAMGRFGEFDARVQQWLQTLRMRARAALYPPALVYDVNSLLDEMRLLKDNEEIALMRHAAEISSSAHMRALRALRPGLREYQLEAELLYEFRLQGAQFPAYTSIVATGANACILHYRAGDARVQPGDLVLIDAGCEFDSYAADITRTFPANGRFSGPQKALYEVVLAAQHAAIVEVMPGKRFSDGHDAAVRVLAQGMLDVGLLDKRKVGTLQDVIANGNYRQFYMHRTGHWLGMDVHDVGKYGAFDEPLIAGQDAPSRKLQPGMTLTVEPGLYVRPAEGVPEQYWHIGIRIEDDVAVTAQGPDILSAAAPKTVTDIEAMMKHG